MRTIGRQVTSLARAVKQTNASLDTHSSLAWHVGTTGVLDRLTKSVEVIGELGVDTLSQDQRQALPAVLEDHVRSREERRHDERSLATRQTWWLIGATVAGSITGAVLAAVAVVAFLSATHHIPGVN